MEEDTVELRMAKLASEYNDMARAAVREADDKMLKADLYEKCAIRIRVALQEAPPPTEHPANGAVHRTAEAGKEVRND